MTFKTSFGQWLKQRRKALDITQEDLAERIGCATITITKIEADERRPSKQLAELLAQHLNIASAEHPAFVRFARIESTESNARWDTPFHPPTNLPTPPTQLIGRDAAVTAIRNRLLQPELRLLTLTGPPGIGKTRLALQTAIQALDDFADGVFLIALAPVTEVDLVSATIAHTLGIPEMGPLTALERLKAFLRDKQTLLLLDNVEQILAVASQIAELLAACPWLKLLITSRAPLRIRQEHQLPVSPLEVPDLAQLPDVETVSHYSAVSLFMERAQAVKPDFILTQENAQAVAAICTRLDGLPLAIELISARVKLLSPTALLERLHGPLLLQSDGLRDIEARHRTLNAAIAWSYQLLSVEEQILFRRLAVFVGGWTLEAAGAICIVGLKLNLLDALSSLLDKNVVAQAPGSNREPRFMMLETVREYGLEQLAVAHEGEQIRAAHCTYFSGFLREHEAFLWRSKVSAPFAAIKAEVNNSRSAWQWAITAGNIQGMIESLKILEVYSQLDDLALVEAEQVLETIIRQFRALAMDPSMNAELARALVWQAHFCYVLGLKHQQSIKQCEESLVIFQRLGLPEDQALALRVLGLILGFHGDSEKAVLLLQEGLALYKQSENLEGIACTLQALGSAAYSTTAFEDARQFFQHALDIFSELDAPHHVAWCENWLGKTAIEQGDYQAALHLIQSSFTYYEEIGHRRAISALLDSLGQIASALDKHQEAIEYFANSLKIARELGDVDASIRFIHSMATNVMNEGNYELAVELFTFLLNFLQPSQFIKGKATYLLENDLKSLLSEEVFVAAQERSRTRTVDDVLGMFGFADSQSS